MPIIATVQGRSRPLDVIDYTVTEDATPLAPGDSSGGVGSMSITARAIVDGPLSERTATLTNHELVLTDTNEPDDSPFLGRGVFYGRVSSCSQPGERVSLSADSLLSKLNTVRTAKPFFGVRHDTPLTTIRTNLIINPSAETNTTGYTGVPGTGGAGALSRQATGGYAGPSKVRYAWTTAATAVGGIQYLISSGITGGSTFTASFYAQVNKTTPPTAGTPVQRLSADIFWQTAGGGAISTTLGVQVTALASSYVRLSATGVAPATAARAVIYVHNVAGTGYANWAIGDQLEIDAGLMEQSSTLGSFFDGSSANSVWSGTANASTSVYTLITPQSIGYNATVANAFRYYCGLVGVNEGSILVDPIYEGIPVAYQGWTGNVWDMAKQLCAAVGAEIVMRNDVILFREPRRHVIPIDRSELFTQSITAQNLALNIEISNYNTKWLSDSVAFSSTSAYSLGSQETQVNIVTTTASLASVNNPVCVTSIQPKPYASGSGQYVITDQNNLRVDPDWWRANGGSITAALDPENPSKIVITSVGAKESGAYKAPFKVAEGFDENEVPSLFITGEGVFIDKQVITIPTGAPTLLTANVTTPTIDNIFITNISQCYDRGVLAAQQHASPLVKIAGDIAYDPTAAGQEFGVVVGARIRVYNGIYRVTSATYKRNSIGIVAEMDMTFDDLVDLFSITFDEFNATYAGLTFDQFNALWSPSFTFAEFDAQTTAPTFDSFNDLFAGLTFDDYAVFPYTKDAIVEDANSKI